MPWERVTSVLGLFVILALAWVMSSQRSKVSWRLLVGGVGLQLLLAVLILSTVPGRLFFDAVGGFFTTMLSFVDQGAGFLFAINARPTDPAMTDSVTLLRTFAFGVLPTVIFFSSFMAVLYYLNIMQWVVTAMAWMMQKTLGTSGAESLAAAANVFVGHTEAPLVVQPFIKGMTRSELCALMVGGFATITGGLMAAYAGMGINPGHLLTASVISAPAALLIAKILEPETNSPATLGSLKVTVERRGINVIEAAAIGAGDGMKLALNIAAMLIAFLALIAMLDAIIGWTGIWFRFQDAEGNPTWSLAAGLGYLFAPIAWLMGIESHDCLRAGELLGLKMVANVFIAYDQLSQWMKPDSTVKLTARSETILTYALSGFSNFGAIGIQIGGIGGIAPERRGDLAQLGLRAMLGGALACCMTGCIAGLLLPE